MIFNPLTAYQNHRDLKKRVIELFGKEEWKKYRSFKLKSKALYVASTPLLVIGSFGAAVVLLGLPGIDFFKLTLEQKLKVIGLSSTFIGLPTGMCVASKGYDLSVAADKIAYEARAQKKIEEFYEPPEQILKKTEQAAEQDFIQKLENMTGQPLEAVVNA